MCQKGDIAEVQHLVQQGADVNYLIHAENYTPLIFTTKEMHLDIVEYLLKCGANTQRAMKHIGHQMKKFTSPLGLKILDALLMAGAPIEGDCSCGSCGHLILNSVANVGSCACLDLIKENGCIDVVNGSSRIKTIKKYDKFYRNCDMWVPLFTAAKAGNLNFVHLLHSYGADINILDHNHTTPLHHACKSNHRDIVDFLIEHDADLNIRSMDKNESAIDYAYRYPADVNLVTHLHKLGAKSEKLESHPLHFAAFLGDLDLFQRVCDNTKDIDIDLRDFVGRTVLHCACYSGNVDMVKKCMEYGPNVNSIEDGYGLGEHYTPLQIAIAWHNPDLVEFLLHEKSCSGVLVNPVQKDVGLAEDSDSDNEDDTWPPLQIACYVGDLNSVQLLLEKGAVAPKGAALSTCCWTNHQQRIPIAFELIDSGHYQLKSPCSYSSSGYQEHCTPLQCTVERNDLELLTALLGKQSFLNEVLQNNDFFTALLISGQESNIECFQTLLKYLTNEQRKLILKPENVVDLLINTLEHRQPEMMKFLLNEVMETKPVISNLYADVRFSEKLGHYLQTHNYKLFLCLDELLKAGHGTRVWSAYFNLSLIYKENLFYFVHIIPLISRKYATIDNNLTGFLIRQKDLAMVQFLSECGLQISPKELGQFHSVHSNSVDSLNFIDEAIDIVSSPFTLMSMCRSFIRESLLASSSDVFQSAQGLPLPKSLVDYLSFSGVHKFQY
jgi:ankyrin repeat protein